MEFDLCQNDQNIESFTSVRNLITQDLWGIPNDNSMDNNDEYFSWTDDLKIDEDKFTRQNNNENIDSKIPRKRKLSTSSNESLKIKNINGFKTIREPRTALDTSEKNGNLKRIQTHNGTSRMPSWQVDDISDLNADLEGSLTGLGGDLSNNSYNMSEAILSTLPVFKQEAPSPTSNDVVTAQHAKHNQQSSSCHPIALTHTNGNTSANDGANNNQNMFNNTLHHLLGVTGYSNLQNAMDGNIMSSPPSLTQEAYHVTSSSGGFGEDSRFQYVLAAATSIATKVTEDTLTYLNQGQSYEIKLKKLGDLSTYRGKVLKTIIRICFHERRLQYMEREQMTLWQHSRPGDRILEVDVPLSYGLCDIVQPSNALNAVAFSWDPTKEVGVYIKVNCISTEFTPKKHGGEKGVPFRIQVETYQAPEGYDASKRLHAAACQIKVFKLKGADRKHKQDREKILKRPLTEQEKFQPSYECTVLNDIPFDAVVAIPPSEPIPNTGPYSPESGNGNAQNRVTNQLPPQIEEANLGKFNQQELSPATSTESNFPNTIPTHVFPVDQLIAGSNPQITTNWLTLNRFDKYLSTFSNFCGADMLRMSRDDLIQICGHADGIRLYNALHSKAIMPKLTIYICRENTSIFNAIFLSTHNSMELMQKLCALSGIPQDQVRDIYMQGPQSIHIHLNNDVIRHIKEETTFSLEINQNNDRYIFVLKPVTK